MALLYSIHLSSPVARFGKPSVHSVENTEGLAGHWYASKLRRVSLEELKAVLPKRWHKALERAAVWYPNDGNIKQAATVRIVDAKGRWVNTVYCIPYVLA